MYEAYPLHWPAGYKRTETNLRKDSAFKQTMSTAQKFLRAELERLEAIDLIVSTNIPVRKTDGGFYADWMHRKMDDPGVAIYFKKNKKQISMCCDQYNTVHENIYALAKGIEAIRGITRWGVSDFIERAFTGFLALPETTDAGEEIWKTLQLPGKPRDKEFVEEHFKKLAKKYHPDIPVTGDSNRFAIINDAYQKALKFFP
jgi:hypothetical protein